MKSSYLPWDVELLLKDISGLVEPLPAAEREKQIQSGTHYCEMLPLEYKPTDKYIEIYERALKIFAKPTADAVGTVSGKIMEKKGENVVLVSLARAGTSVGVLIRRYIRYRYGITAPHYSISIIRDRGIDHNALRHIISRHRAQDILFVDGWVGKGAIFRELKKELISYPNISSDIAVLADPANLTELCGTHEDILIPSSCLNCTVSGLISRTFLRPDIIGEDDFHGAAYYGELEAGDRTYEFIDAVAGLFSKDQREAMPAHQSAVNGYTEVRKLADWYGVSNINLVKPGIGETTRVLLRRIPWKILVDEKYKASEELAHIIQLAEEKKVAVEYTHLVNYKCCGIIKKVSDV